MDGITPSGHAPYVHARQPYHQDARHAGYMHDALPAQPYVHVEPYIHVEPHTYARRVGRPRKRVRSRTSMDGDHDHEYGHDEYEHVNGHVTHEHIIENKEEKKGGKGMLEGLLLGMCQKQGIDPGLVALMKDCDHGRGRGDDGLFGGSGLLVLLFLIILMGGRGFGGFGGGFGCADGGHGHVGGHGHGGYGHCGVDNKVLFEAICGNREAIEHVSAQLGQSTDSIKTAICCLDKGIALLDGKIGHMDADLKCAIKECCCNMQLAVERSTNVLTREICGVSHNIDSKFCNLERRMDDKFCSIEKLIVATDNNNRIRELEEEKAALQAMAFQSSQREQTAEILKAIKCEPRNVCFPERPPCDCDRRDRRC